MKNLYKSKPTPEFIQKALNSLGIQNLQDTRRVCETHLQTHLMEEVRDELQGFMYPVFYKQFVLKEDFDYKGYLTIIRQLLRLQNRKLLRTEKCELVGPKTYKYVPYYSLDIPPTHDGVVTFTQ